MIRASAPGKLILFGEHAVVYGEAAISTAIDKRAYVNAEILNEPKIVVESKNLNTITESSPLEKTNDPVVRAVQVSLEYLNKKQGIKIVVDSEIPVSAGLGSSAAVISATSLAVLKLISNEDIETDIVSKLSFEAEKIAHGKPSGIDTTISAFGGTIYFQKGNFERIQTEPIYLVVGNTGIKKSTKEIVENIRKRSNDPHIVHILSSIGYISKKAKISLQQGNLKELGNLMNKNHFYLRELGVSSVELEKLIDIAKKAGAYGAKLTGAGGGGCIIALTDYPEKVIEALNETGADAFLVKTNQSGVRID